MERRKKFFNEKIKIEYDIEKPKYLMKYMDLSKLLYLLNEKKLYFTCADNFEDKFEGVFLNPIIKYSYDLYKNDIAYIFRCAFLNEDISNGKIKSIIENNKVIELYNSFRYSLESSKKDTNKIFEKNKNFDDSKINEIFDEDHMKELWKKITNNEELFLRIVFETFKVAWEEYKKKINEQKKYVYISCWYNSDNESEAMWKLYGSKYGIAIKVNFEKLINNFAKNNLKFFSGKIIYEGTKYNNSNNELSSDIISFFIKRNCYEHEKEYRFLIEEKDISDKEGIEFDLEKLDFIEEIIISPFLPIYEAEQIKKTINQLLKNKISVLITKNNRLTQHKYLIEELNNLKNFDDMSEFNKKLKSHKMREDEISEINKNILKVRISKLNDLDGYINNLFENL